MLPLDAIIYVN